MTQEESRLEESILELVIETATSLPGDVEEALRRALSRESSSRVLAIYRAYLENARVARSRRLPLCQDTGTPEFFVWLGEHFPRKSLLLRALRGAVLRAEREGYLRANACHPLTGRPLESRALDGYPWVHVAGVLEGRDDAIVALYLSGGGASRPSLARVLDPLEAPDGVVRLVLEALAGRASKACPPLVVGVGLASTIEAASLYSKMALLRPLGVRSPVGELAELEEEIVEAGNRLGIGAQGLGGSVTVLDAHVEASPSHPSALAVAVSFSCWAMRRSRARVSSSLDLEVIPYVYGRS